MKVSRDEEKFAGNSLSENDPRSAVINTFERKGIVIVTSENIPRDN